MVTQALIYKLNALPDTLEPNGIYLIKNGSNIDIYIAGLDGTAYTSVSAQRFEASETTWGSIAGDIDNQADLSAALSQKANLSHSHAISDITGLQSALDGKQASLPNFTSGQVLFGDGDNVPSTSSGFTYNSASGFLNISSARPEVSLNATNNAQSFGHTFSFNSLGRFRFAYQENISCFSIQGTDTNGNFTLVPGLLLRRGANNFVGINISPGVQPLSQLTVNGSVFVGGNAAAARQLEILHSSSPQLRLTQTAGSIFTDLQTTTSGNLLIDASGGYVLITNDRLRLGTDQLLFQGLHNVRAGIVFSSSGDQAGLAITDNPAQTVRKCALSARTSATDGWVIVAGRDSNPTMNLLNGQGFMFYAEGGGGAYYTRPGLTISTSTTLPLYGYAAHTYFQSTAPGGAASPLSATGTYINYISTIQIATQTVNVGTFSDYQAGPFYGPTNGTITNRYGLHITFTSASITNPYGIYQESDTLRNYFNGSLGVGVATNHASAKVQIDSATQGFLPPRMTTTQINAIASPAEGLVVYNTTISHLCVYQAGAWAKLSYSLM